MTDSAGRSKGCGMVEFSEPEAVARAIEVWRQKRHPRWSKLIVERVRRARFADAAASKRAVVAGTRARAASVERADAASEALVRAEAAEARVAGVEAQVVAAEARAAAAETRARAAEARVAAAEMRAVAAETQARAAQEDRMRAYVTASELQVATSGLLAKLDASEAAAAAATALAAETERERLENQLVLSPGEDLPDPDHMIPSPPYEPLPMPFYVPTVPVHPPPMVLGPIAPGSIPWSYYAPPPPPDTIFQGTVIDFKSEATVKRRYGIIRVDHTHNLVFLSPQDAPDGYVSDGDRCEFRIVEYKNQKNRKLEGTRLQWKAVDVVCVQRAAAVPVPPQPSC
jgi:hypothetical protein